MTTPSSKFYKNIEKGATTPGCVISKSLQSKGKVSGSEELLSMWLPAEETKNISKRLNFTIEI